MPSRGLTAPKLQQNGHRATKATDYFVILPRQTHRHRHNEDNMKKLLSLPPNLVESFHDITGLPHGEWFCSCDPADHKLGSGGGTTWLLLKALTGNNSENGSLSEGDLAEAERHLADDRRIIIHAGGQSRRLPSYAPSGKILTPIPVFRWERGQKLSQNLLSLQLPLYEDIMDSAPSGLHTMVVSGDVLIRTTSPLPPIPNADVVCLGLWLGPEIAKDHGVFVISRDKPEHLECMLQKPSTQTLASLLQDNFYLTDIGVWMFSDRAIKMLMEHSVKPSGDHATSEVTDYDLYGTFGCCLGTKPTLKDDDFAQLSVAIVPIDGEFYHFGTSHELLSSTLAIQNLINDQRRILHLSRKPHPAIFVQNAVTQLKLTADNENVWIENSHIGARWTLTEQNIITGVPENDWEIKLQPGQCVDIVPIGETQWVVRPYLYNDTFAGQRQFDKLFPIANSIDEAGLLLRHMLGLSQEGQAEMDRAEKLCAADISLKANLRRLTAQRRLFRAKDWPALAANHDHSVFYQLDLDDAADEFARFCIPEPAPLRGEEPLIKQMDDAMFRARLHEKAKGQGNAGSAQASKDKAFALLRKAMTGKGGTGLSNGTMGANRPSAFPASTTRPVASDQIVWARSPVRIDIAGGWTDTPPYCLIEGGSVVNFAIELNGQPPIQTYVKPCAEPHIVLRSIDLGAQETVDTYEQLQDYRRVGSPFSIPKAALTLCGFCSGKAGNSQGEGGYKTLHDQLSAFGHGIEVTLLSAIPAGSGLGTSSILAATVLGALGDFCGKAWDKQDISRLTLTLEQMLTTGGGWQDQFGGLEHGVKLLETQPGMEQRPVVRHLPEALFTKPEYQQCQLLYYTGLRRTAKTILAEIVQGMFLNRGDELRLLRHMKAHSQRMYDAIEREDFEGMGRLVRKTWEQNQALDSGTNPPEVQRLTSLIDDLCLGYKLPGAGGGGYLYIIAKDPEAATRIKRIVADNPVNANARFVGMTLSGTGLQISRS